MKIRYTNYKGVTSDRNIIPLFPYLGSNEWHPERQWLLKAWDIDKKAMRSFSVKGILNPRFTKYNSNNNKGWYLCCDKLWMEFDYTDYSDRADEWNFSIVRDDTGEIFSIYSCDVFTWLPAKVNMKTKFKEFDIFGVTLGILL